METNTVTFIEVQKAPEYIQKFLDIEDTLYKKILFHKDIAGKQFQLINCKMEDGKIYWSETMFVMKPGKGCYYKKASQKRGFTFDGKKLNIWFGRNVAELSHKDIFTTLNIDWMESSLYNYITKPGLERILKGKITNPIDFLKHFLKLQRMEASPTFMYKWIKNGSSSTRNYFLSIAYCVKNIDHFLQNPDLHLKHQVHDIVEQCKILDKKIDWNWSEKRLMQEHSNMTSEIMLAEIEHIEDSVAPEIDIEYPEEFILLNTTRKVFYEGNTMKHCLYTNYLPEILRGRYVAFHIDREGEQATLGLNRDREGKITFSQLYRKGNQPTSESLRKYCEDWVKGLNVELQLIEQEELGW